jgi:hypothetical protein
VEDEEGMGKREKKKERKNSSDEAYKICFVLIGCSCLLGRTYFW